MQRSSSPSIESSQSSPLPINTSECRSTIFHQAKFLLKTELLNMRDSLCISRSIVQQTFSTYLSQARHNEGAVVILGLSALTPVPISHTTPPAGMLDFVPAFFLQG